MIISLPSAVVLEWKPSVHTQAAWGAAALQTASCLQQNKLRAVSGLLVFGEALWLWLLVAALPWGCALGSKQPREVKTYYRQGKQLSVFLHFLNYVCHTSKPLSNLTQIHHKKKLENSYKNES